MEKTTEKSRDFVKKKMEIIPKVKPKSPILLTINAFIAALLAFVRVNQKLINKYEQIPTPSHPKNKTKKLLDNTRINIKRLNKDT